MKPALAAALAFLLAAILWSYVGAHDRLTWWIEALPALIALVLLAATWRRFPLTPLAYGLIWGHCLILLVGAHYTYAEVPLFNWLRDAWDLSRNHYDRIGHFAQGFVPAIVARELLIRTSPLAAGRWLAAIVTLSCLGIIPALDEPDSFGGLPRGTNSESMPRCGESHVGGIGWARPWRLPGRSTRPLSCAR